MFLHILELFLCFLVLQINSHPLSKMYNREVKDIQFQDYDDNVKIDSNGYNNSEKNLIIHPIIKKTTNTGKGIKILVDPEMSVDEIKASLIKKKTEYDIKKSLKSLTKNSKNEQNANVLVLNNSSNNLDKTYSKVGFDEKNLILSGNDKKAKPVKEPVYVLLKEGGLSHLNESDNFKVSTTLDSQMEEMVTDDSCLTTESCIDLSEHISQDLESTTGPCKKTSIVCIDLLDESEKDLLISIGEPDNSFTEVESSTSKSWSEVISKLTVENTIEISTEASFSERYKFHGEENIGYSSATADVATIVEADFKKFEKHTSGYNNSLEDLLDKQKIQTIFDTSKNQNNISDYYKLEGDNSKKTEHKVMSFKPTARVKSAKSKQYGNLQLQSQENNTLNNDIFKSIEKQYPNLFQGEKKKIMTDNNKKSKPIKEPVYVLLDNKELSVNAKEPDICISPVVTTETSEVTTETTTESTTEVVMEDLCLTTTPACVDLAENISTSQESTTGPCRKTSIICIDLIDEAEKEMPMAVSESENNTEFQGFEEVANTSLTETSEMNVLFEDFFKLTVEEPSSTISLGNVTTEELISTGKEGALKHKVKQSSAGGDTSNNLQNLPKKQKISIDLDILKNDNNNSEYRLISKGGHNEEDENSRTVNGSIKFVINNSTGENTDENEELEISLP